MNKPLKAIRAEHWQKVKVKPGNIPVAIWLEDDLLQGKQVKALTAVFRTTGCTWAKTGGCTMCGYIYDASPTRVSNEELLAQLQAAMKKLTPEVKVAKIFTSGSFLDPSEVPIEVRNIILKKLGESTEKVIVETRPEFVKDETVIESRQLVKNLEIAIGLETASDVIRQEHINKGFTFSDFIEAAKTAHDCDSTVKAYLLLKPPFLTEKAAIEDMISSIQDTAIHADTISVNLCNIQRGTLVFELFAHRSYRPPWLWSAVEVLKQGKKILGEKVLMSDPVAAGSKRGPHNCGKCDSTVAAAIKQFSLTQNTEALSNLNCDCRETWKKVLELEEYTFGAPLI